MNLLSVFTFVSTISNFQYSTIETLDFSIEAQSVVYESYNNKQYLFDSKDQELNIEKSVKTVSIFAWEESSFDNLVLGDNGKACSVMQLHYHARFGLTCNELQSSRKLALATGFKFMIYLKKFCNGNIRKAFLAYASGKCDGNKKAIEIVDRRCSFIGGC